MVFKNCTVGRQGVSWEAVSTFNNLVCASVTCHPSHQYAMPLIFYIKEVVASTIPHHMTKSVQQSLWWTLPWQWWQKIHFHIDQHLMAHLWRVFGMPCDMAYQQISQFLNWWLSGRWCEDLTWRQITAILGNGSEKKDGEIIICHHNLCYELRVSFLLLILPKMHSNVHYTTARFSLGSFIMLITFSSKEISTFNF